MLNINLHFSKPEQVISKETAAEMKRMLIKTVQEGTGRSARIEGLEIGGKTGTAQIAGGTGYLKNIYHLLLVL